MIPNPDSSEFIRHEIPDCASKIVLRLRYFYDLLKANINASVWKSITLDDICMEYNTYLGSVCIKAGFIDKNNHTHSFSIDYNQFGKITCNYLFEGSVNANVISFRSYAEWLMLQLWKYDIDSELCHCDRGLTVASSIECAYDVMAKMMDIVTNNIKPIEWFLSEEPIWQFYKTHQDLCKMLPRLQKEAANERWKNVKPENFRLIKNADYAFICLDYTDDINYTMRFRVGMDKNGFAANRTDKFLDMSYEFVNQAPDEKTREYYECENLEFSKLANYILDIPFGWKALLFHQEDGVYINTYQEYAFQKYCLLLDFMLPFKDQYEATEMYISPELLDQKRQLETALSTELEISEDEDTKHIFAHGYFIEDSKEEETFDQFPF